MSILKNITKKIFYCYRKSRIAYSGARSGMKNFKKQSGAVASEYALVSGLIVLILILGASAVDSPINSFLVQVVTIISAWMGI